MAGMSTPDNKPSTRAFTRANVASYLTQVAYGSAPFIATFAMIHLTAPAMANLGGTSLASQTMILGREYYQTSFGEKYLVFAPLIIHPAAGLIKRIISPPNLKPRRLSSPLSLTGYALATFLLPTHFLIHRYYSSNSSAPIHAVGPSELDLEFVKTGLQEWPWRSWALYAGLLICFGMHVVDGTTLLAQSWSPEFSRPGTESRRSARNTKIAIIFTLGVLPVLSGMWWIAKEPTLVLSSLARRYEAVFAQSFIYRLGAT
ncbi:hypothetical protein HGRIS_013613 [Hohenbuehelia grisea]|uniref:Mitochondrial adapter protein MCP1 transmembrane domain-containing protein n=1 Tax=Hohenbuehelia grisea TaxID=104357 RepID=A0ABR3IW96_9AGAR